MSDVELRSRQQILGSMIARIKAETDINGIFPGSAILTILEAAASSDFLTEAKLLQLLNLRNIDKATGVDLENLAFEMGVSPTRIGAGSAQTRVTVLEQSFSKVASNIYAGSNAPAAGDTIVRIIDSTGFDAAGTIYIGRGTQTAETIDYISYTNTGSYTEITLASPLQKDHLVGEEVVMSQGGSRLITAGTTVQSAGQSGLAGIVFVTQYQVELADGEDTISGILAIAAEPGSQGNVAKGKINSFQGAPWSVAAVTNNDPSTGGTDPETDTDLRQRVKDHVHSLSGGTERAIVRAVVGSFDDQENKRVVSAFLKKPTSPTDSTILYIDDGNGYAPPFSGIGEEIIITKTAGTEQFVQLQQWPLVKSQVASVGTEPFNLSGGESLYVEVDGLVEERTLPSNSYITPSVVTAQEVAEAINKWFTTIEARAKDGQLFITPTSDDPDWIRVGVATLGGGDVNTAIRFPVKKQYTVRIYKDDKLLEKNGSEAVVQSLANSQWTGLTSTESLQFNVDNIDSPIVSFTNIEFLTYTSSATIAGATVNDWVIMINRKFIGVTAIARDDGTFIVKSNRGRTNASVISMIGGTASAKLFPANSSSTGKAPEYKLNKLLGQIELSNRMVLGEELKAGNSNTRGFALTSDQAAFNLAATNSHAAEMVIIADAPYVAVLVANSNIIVFSVPSTGVTKITGDVGQFSNVKKDDFCHLYNTPRHGLLRVISVAVDGSSVSFADPDPEAGTTTLDGVNIRVRFFRTEGLPQLLILPIGPAIVSVDVVNALNNQILGATAEVTDSGAIRIQTNRFDGAASLSIPSIAGNASNLGILESNYLSNDPHTAAIESGLLDGTASKRIKISVNDNVAPYDDLQAVGTPFTNENANTGLEVYIGSASRIIRQPIEMSSSNALTLNNKLPFQHVGLGPDMSATTLSGMEFGQADNMVFLVDNDPAKKTFDIPMFVDGTISGPSVPSTIQMDIQDSTGAALGSSTRWSGHPFEDYRIWFKAKNGLPYSNTNSQIRITSVPYGPNGEKTKVGIFYPTQANAPAIASFSVNGLTDEILVNVSLSSKNQRLINLQPNRRVDLESLASNIYRVHFLPPVDLTSVVLGDVVSINDSQFNSNNQGQMQVSAIQNNLDVGHAWEFKSETVTGDVASSTTLTLGTSPVQPARIGDKVKHTGITKPITYVDVVAEKVFVEASSPFNAGPDQFVVNGNTYTYTDYTASNGIFAGVFPSPISLTTGDELYQATAETTRLVTAVSGNVLTVASPGFANGSDKTFTLTHAYVTVSSAPSYAPAAGDRLQIGSSVHVITTIYNTLEFGVDAPFSWTGNQSGALSRIYLEGPRYNAGSSESHQVLSGQSIQIYDTPAAENKASVLISLINATAGVKDIVSASNAPANDGSGAVVKSTEDEIGAGNRYVSLQNGESYVYSTSTTSPAIRLKHPSTNAPEIGEKVRLVPTTAKNIASHFIRKQISGLTLAADVALVDRGRRVQISSKVSGGLGQVYAVGGRASGQNVLVIRGTSQELNSTRAQIELDKSSIDLLIPGHTIKIEQLDRAKKRLPVNASSTTIEIQIPTPNEGHIISSAPFVSLLAYSQSGTVKYAVRNIGRNRVRYELLSGTSVLPTAVKADDWVLIGDGSSYAGITTDTVFAPANRGWFQVRETDNATYFDVDGSGVEEFVTTTTTSFVFCTYHSARIGDRIVIGFDAPISTANKGTFEIVAVNSVTSVTYLNPLVETQAPIALGVNGTTSVGVLDQGYSTYRKVVLVAPKPSDPTSRALVVIEPGYDISLFSEGQRARVKLPNRLNYGTDPVPGVSGYSYWTGLKRRVQRVVDGYEPDSASFEGVAAAGVSVEVREPQIQRVKISAKIKTSRGVSLQALSDTIKSAIYGHINSRNLGEDVVMSEIIKIIQQIPGIEACVLVFPIPSTERIVVADSSIARISIDSITLS